MFLLRNGVHEMLLECQRIAPSDCYGWGNGALKRLSEDMHNYYPEIKGFSVRNCQCMIQFYEEYNQELTLPKSGTPIAQLPVAQLGEAKTQPAVAQLPEYNITRHTVFVTLY